MDTIVSINPATLETIGRTPITTPAMVKECVAAAHAAQGCWGQLSFHERGRYLLRAREYLLDHIDEIARTIAADNGKPLAEALTAEIYPVADLIHHFAHHAEGHLRSFRIPIGIMGTLRRRSRINFTPLGVVGIVSPWNYPFSIPAGEIAMALICGNAVLLKPSSTTALVGANVAEMFEAAELPAGIFHHLPGDASTGEALIGSHLDKLLFTGSVGVGRHVMGACTENLTPCVLELGGKDPMIVRVDADLDVASSGAVWGAFTNAGQCCASVERCYVHESRFEEFVERCVRKTMALRVGNGLNPNIDVGPLTTEAQRDVVEAHVADARGRGATIPCGGERLENLPGYFFPPTILTGVDHSFTCVRDETFGPLLPIMPFSDDAQAVHLANDSAFGLTASIWTRDIRTGQKMARAIRTGTVMINDCVFTHALSQTPWGGCKNSGFGRSHSRFGLHELVHVHHTHTNRLNRKDFWWYPYDADFLRNFTTLARRLTGGILSQMMGIPAFVKTWRKRKL